MLEKLFNYDNPVFRFFGKVGYIWYLNFLWLVCSLPIITIGASTTALLYSSMKLKADEGYVTKNFFKSFRENFRQSTILFLLFAAAGALLGLSLIYWNQLGGVFGKTMKVIAAAASVVYLLDLLYVFAVQARFVNPIKRTVQYAFMLSVKNFIWTIQMAIIAGFVIWVNTTVILANLITLNIGIGVMAYLFGIYYSRIFAPYIEAAKEQEASDA